MQAIFEFLVKCHETNYRLRYTQTRLPVPVITTLLKFTPPLLALNRASPIYRHFLPSFTPFAQSLLWSRRKFLNFVLSNFIDFVTRIFSYITLPFHSWVIYLSELVPPHILISIKKIASYDTTSRTLILCSFKNENYLSSIQLLSVLHTPCSDLDPELLQVCYLNTFFLYFCEWVSQNRTNIKCGLTQQHSCWNYTIKSASRAHWEQK